MFVIYENYDYDINKNYAHAMDNLHLPGTCDEYPCILNGYFERALNMHLDAVLWFAYSESLFQCYNSGC